MSFGSILIGLAIVAGVVWTLMPVSAPSVPVLLETKTMKSMMTLPERKAADLPPPVKLDKVTNVSEECSKTAIAAANFDIRAVSSRLQKTTLEKPGDLSPRFSFIFSKLREFRAKDKCAAVAAEHPISKVYAAYAIACSGLPVAAPGSDVKNSPEAMRAALACITAMEELRFGVVTAAYAGVPIEKITDPGGLRILYEAALRDKGEKHLERTYEVAHQLAKMVPTSNEAATLEMQAAYQRLITKGGGKDEKSQQQAFNEAMQHLERLDPGSSRLQEIKLATLARGGYLEKFGEMAAEIKRTQPDNELGHIYSAANSYLHGERKAAVDEMEDYVKQNPDNRRAAASLEAMKLAPVNAKIDELVFDEDRGLLARQSETKAVERSTASAKTLK